MACKNPDIFIKPKLEFAFSPQLVKAYKIGNYSEEINRNKEEILARFFVKLRGCQKTANISRVI